METYVKPKVACKYFGVKPQTLLKWSKDNLVEYKTL